MNITLYGPETEKYELANELSALPDCRYRNICIKGFSDYDSFISNLGEGPPELVLMPLGWFAQRANQTTARYAGVSKKLYKKILLSSTIRLFKS